jgi:hypothetical protein
LLISHALRRFWILLPKKARLTVAPNKQIGLRGKCMGSPDERLDAIGARSLIADAI